MNKFSIANEEILKTESKGAVLFKVIFGGSKYYIHKSKSLKDGVNKFLDDIFRGTRGLSCSDYYKRVVEYCKRYPAIYEVRVDLLLNGAPAAILNAELKELKNKDKECCLNTDMPQFKPEWMLKEVYHKRCENCIRDGFINKVKTKFRFCPNCGHLNK